ncbi:putative proactivator polypeptide-like 1 [Cocos nucifera]|uniref:Putative proactivator polypeptide-like 1 n=1 Tax=Cocos nucifera TaxID=13894 RepID=A0A8K0N3K2_COCNU|nr:putative proactivator polypeptide-like 1 [Cocos nucifera]
MDDGGGGGGWIMAHDNVLDCLHILIQISIDGDREGWVAAHLDVIVPIIEYMMEIGMLSSFLVLLVMLSHVDARLGIEPKFMDQGNKLSSMEGQSPNSICNSCLEASRKAEKALSDPNLFGYADLLSSEVCHILPSELKSKCLQKSEAYMHQTRLFLQDLFNEESLCNSTGLCLDESMLQTDNSLNLLNKFSPEMKIMETLIEYCEEADENEEQCKQMVYKYVPLILSKLDKLKTNDLCRLMNLCDEGISL